ncbi:MAG: MFS transporter [Advenella sp.]
MSAPAKFTLPQAASYGTLGLPLAFIALPLYILLPNYYANEFGVSLTVLGLLFLASRLFDALTDPLLGRLSDVLFNRANANVMTFIGLTAVILVAGLAGLLFPPAVATSGSTLILWIATCLLITYTAYSFLMIMHQSWGARLGGDAVMRGKIVAARESAGLIGVMLASAIPGWLGYGAMLTSFVACMGLGLFCLSFAHKPASRALHTTQATSVWHPFRQAPFRSLLLVFSLNGIASAVPATLVLFFIQDRIRAPIASEPWFLGLYFLCAALSMPCWLYIVRRIGLAKTWLIGMLLSIIVFVWTLFLGEGDALYFAVICAFSGFAVGADLALPGAILAGLIHSLGDGGKHEGAYLGWWNFMTKANLALAAGLTLPLLEWLGYTPGTHDAQALQMLSLVYAGLPCLLKLFAACALYRFSQAPHSPQEL